MAISDEERKLPLNLAVYDEPAEVVLPAYCRWLNVYRSCEDDWPVVYVFVEEMKEAA